MKILHIERVVSFIKEESMKRRITVALIAALVVSLAGCNRGNQAGSDERIKLELAWIADTADLSQQNFFNAGRAYADYLNKTRDDIFVTLTQYDGQLSVEKQISDIETAVTKGSDALLISCVDPDGIRPAALKAMADGARIVDWRDMGQIAHVTFTMADQHSRGKFTYDWVKEYLQTHPDVSLNAGLMYGAPSHPTAQYRLIYLRDLVTEFPGRFTILTENYSDWSAGTSMTITEDWLQKYHEMNFICSASEEQMLGSIEALRGAQLLDKFILTTFNGEQTGVDLLRKGEIQLDIGTVTPVAMGLLVEFGIRVALEPDFSGYYDMSPYTLFKVTQENVEDYANRIIVDYDNIHYFDTTLKLSYKDVNYISPRNK
jgi:ABC-type sugar transport system substrate-binding protein